MAAGLRGLLVADAPGDADRTFRARITSMSKPSTRPARS
jgi:hypothetical protein